jgi:cytochrome bd-type quinol oxidase subunit 2
VVTDPEPAIERLEERLGRLLKIGAWASAACLFAGLSVWIAGGRRQQSNALLSTGLLILMATPILRVIVSLVAYAKMRDWFFVTTTLIVLGVLIATVTLALLKA